MTTFVMYVLPGTYWTGGPDPALIRPLLKEAVSLRRRVAKGANLEAERVRYTACLADLEGRLEASVPLAGQATPAAVASAARSGVHAAFTLPPLYFDLLARAHLEHVELQSNLEIPAAVTPGAEVGATVLRPDALTAHAAELDRLASSSVLAGVPELEELARERAALIRAVSDVGAGIVEVIEELDVGMLPPPPDRAPTVRNAPMPPQPSPEATTAKGRKRMANRFARALEAALPARGLVNLSDQPHEVSTEVLAQFLYAVEGSPAGQVRVEYADGSEAKPFPLRAITPPAAPTPPKAERVDGLVELSVALMSMRHLELDPFVERAWYRNKEVSVTRPLAESDEFCFQFSVRELTELREVYAGETVLIRMFHTGFEPAAVGFYRAVAAELKTRRGWLRVLPHYYRGGTRFETGRVVWE